MMNQTAQGLASLGRNGDSMLVHMSPEEVGGLKQVGESLGIKMTTNPYTGMPEAFSFTDFFTSFIPTIVGAAVGGPPGAGFMSSTMTPILAGAGTGALLAAAKGDDPLMGGLTGGLGGYGGSQLGPKISKAFGSASGTTAQSFDDLINANIQGTGASGAMFGGTGQSPLQAVAPGQGGLGLSSAKVADTIIPKAPVSFTSQVGQNLSDLGTGTTELLGLGDRSISEAYKAFTDPAVGGTAMDLAMPVGGGVLAGLEPSDFGYGNRPLYEDPDKGKYRGPQGQLNLSDQFDTGLRLVAKGGYINGYALGGAVNTNPSVGGGLSDLYNRPEGATAQNISADGYGIGRLNNLAGEQSRYQAQTLGYADGGNVNNSETDKPNPEGIVSLYKTVVDDKGVSSRERVPYQYSKIITPGAADFYDISPIEYATNVYPGAILPKFKKEQMAKGGYLDGAGDGMNAPRGFADGGSTTIEVKDASNLDRLPTLNLETGKASFSPDGPSYMNSDWYKKFIGMPEFEGRLQMFSQPARFGGETLFGGLPIGEVLNNAFNKSKNMAQGGYLDGQGDGMSDSIPATIEGKQPARLADGEFVVPADVVSHIGNGSSKAGSQRLYSMLDRVRKARTGTKKQGKQIKAEKYLPA